MEVMRLGIPFKFGEFEGLLTNEKTNPNDHQYGIVTLLVKKILDEEGSPDPKNKPKSDLNTERPNWGSYPIIFGEKL